MCEKVVGTNLPKVDARSKVTGEAKYPDDLYFDNMLHVKVKRAVHPHAYLRRLDTMAAEKLPGVVKVITAEDYPDLNKFGLIIKDQPVLIGIDEKMRFMGDALAIVVAEDKETATRALDLIEVEVEELEVISDPLRALEEDAPTVHEEGSPLLSDIIDKDKSNNVLRDDYLEKGDVEKGFERANVIVENEYRTQHIDQLPLQVEAGLAVYEPENDMVKIWAATQWLHDTQADIAQSLGLSKDKVQIIQPAIGGAFGKKEDISVQIHLALAAMETGKPVKLTYSREESMISQSKRHPMIIKFKTGATAEGYLSAWQAEVIGDTGAYASSGSQVIHKGMFHCTGPYNCENIKGVSYAVYTNNTYAGAMRGFGTTQMAFAYESQMDQLAEKLDIHPAEFRYRNAYQVGSITPNGQRLSRSVNVRQTIAEAVDMTGWKGVEFNEEKR